MNIILIVLVIILGITAWKYYVAGLILSGWIVEQKCKLPTDEDIKRLRKWAVKKILKSH